MPTDLVCSENISIRVESGSRPQNIVGLIRVWEKFHFDPRGVLGEQSSQSARISDVFTCRIDARNDAGRAFWRYINESQQRGAVVFKNTSGATVCTFDGAISLDSMEGVIPVEFRAQEFKRG